MLEIPWHISARQSKFANPPLGTIYSNAELSDLKSQSNNSIAGGALEESKQGLGGSTAFADKLDRTGLDRMAALNDSKENVSFGVDPAIYNRTKEEVKNYAGIFEEESERMNRSQEPSFKGK